MAHASQFWTAQAEQVFTLHLLLSLVQDIRNLQLPRERQEDRRRRKPQRRLQAEEKIA